MQLKILEWLHRYLPAEIVAIIGALIGGVLTHYLFGNPVLTALGGTWSENIGYYGQIFFTDLREIRKRDQKITAISILKVLRNVVVEFGPAEYVDSFFIRPVAMYFFMRIADNVPLGLFLGKITADITFYFPAIIGYEVRRKYFKD